MSEAVKIGIVGDFDPGFEPHVATNEAVQHAAAALGIAVESRWIPSASLLSAEGRSALEQLDAIWHAPGSPQSLDGALVAIRYAREQDRPLFGN